MKTNGLRFHLPVLIISAFGGWMFQAPAQESGPEPLRLLLWPDGAPQGDGTTEETSVSITVHLPAKDQSNGSAMIICPGGGYGTLVTGPEGHGIAKWLNGNGIAGIVLEYRLLRGRPMVPLLDAQRAVRTVRSRARDWSIDPNRIGIIGFSAGGHLASTALTHFDPGDPTSNDLVERLSCRPDFGVLVYPVISMGPLGHAGSRKNLLGPEPGADLIEKFSNEKQVTAATPPVFLAHPADDKVVVVDNSRLFDQALQSRGVPSKFLELPSGGHGLNGYQGPMWDQWQRESLLWLKEQGF